MIDKLKLAINIPLDLPGGDSAFTDLVVNRKLSVNRAINLLTWEAYIRKETDIVDIKFPIISDLLSSTGISGEEEEIFDLLRIFYSIYSCCLLSSDNVLLSSEETLSLIEDVIEKYGLGELLKYPEKVIEFLPRELSLDEDCYYLEEDDITREIKRRLMKDSGVL